MGQDGGAVILLPTSKILYEAYFVSERITNKLAYSDTLGKGKKRSL